MLTASLPCTEEPGATVSRLCTARDAGDRGSARNWIRRCCSCCWVIFPGEAMQSRTGRLEPAGRARMKEDILGGLPGWEKGTFGGETGEGADFQSQCFPAAQCSAASACVRRCRRSRQPADGSLVFPKDGGWHLPFCSRANRQRRCCFCLDWGRRNLAWWLFFLLLPLAAWATYLQTAVRRAEIISWKDQMR